MLQDLYTIKGKGKCPLGNHHSRTRFEEFVPVKKCKQLNSCISRTLLERTRSSWNSLFGTLPTPCEEGKRFVIRDFLSKEECKMLQNTFSNAAASGRHYRDIVRDIAGFEKTSMFDSNLEHTCKEPWLKTYLNISRRIEKTLEEYFLPGLGKDVRLETDAINVFTSLSMKDDLKSDESAESRFVFPANAHCDSCSPRRVLVNYSTDQCVPQTRIDCDYATHPFPHRKLTTVLYLSESVQLNAKQIERSRFIDTLHLPIENAAPRPRNRDTAKCLDSAQISSFYKREQDHLRRGQQDVERLKSTISREQKQQYENKEFVSLGDGLCFVNYDDDVSSSGSSSIECGHPRRDVETGCCERLVRSLSLYSKHNYFKSTTLNSFKYM